MPTLLDVTFETPLHPGQQEVLDHPARFKVLACGRRWGKTKLAGLICVKRALEGGAVWYVGPDYKRMSRGWREMKELAMQIPGTVIRESDKRIEFVSGGWLETRSANDANALRGEGLDLVVSDEAAFMRETTWTLELRPALADHEGDALLISTFDGENYFYDLYERGQDPDYPEWASWRFPTATNPFIAPEEIEEARATTPQAEFEQEFMANPLVYVGAVFPGEKVQAAAERGLRSQSANTDTEVFAGLDWGYTNATAFEVCREHSASGRVTWFDERDWVATQLETRVARIVELCREHGIEEIYADAAGASENAALSAALDDARLPTGLIRVGFGTRLRSGETAKDAGIKTRRWYLEQDLEDIAPDCSELIRTTKRYRYKENSEDVLKEDDHPVDAVTAFYASRRSTVVDSRSA